MQKKIGILIMFLLLTLLLPSPFSTQANSNNISIQYNINHLKKPIITWSTTHNIIEDTLDEIILFEGFEHYTFPPKNWIREFENSNYTWQRDNINAYEGTYSASCKHDPFKNFQDEWLITPLINLTDYYQSYLNFHWFMSYFWGVYPYDNYDFTVYIIANDGKNLIPIWNEEEDGTFENWVWYNTSKGESIDISPYFHYDSIRIGFQYKGSDGAQLNLDNICIYGNRHTNPLNVDAGGPYNAYVREPIYFHGNVTGGEAPYDWSWDFDDGNQSNRRNPIHSYSTVGNYTVTLKVNDAHGITNIDNTVAQIDNMTKVPQLIITNISGGNTFHATIQNVGNNDAEEVHWKIHLKNLLRDNITEGNISCIEKKCCLDIYSKPINGLGLININFIVYADNMNRISKQCIALMIGKLILPV